MQEMRRLLQKLFVIFGIKAENVYKMLIFCRKVKCVLLDGVSCGIILKAASGDSFCPADAWLKLLPVEEI